MLRVDFERCGDRFAHQVSWTLPDGTSGCLISQEGHPDEAWPPSPVLQSLNLETRPGEGQSAMLVGMAGRNHWSMSVEADLDRNRLLFDVACRMQELPLWLGSTYTVLNQSGAAWPLDCLTLTAWHGEQTDQAIFIQMDRQKGTLRIPAPPATAMFPQTIRWRYEIGVRK